MFIYLNFYFYFHSQSQSIWLSLILPAFLKGLESKCLAEWGSVSELRSLLLYELAMAKVTFDSQSSSPNFSILSLQMTFSHLYEGIMENLQKTSEGHISSSQEDTETQRDFPKFLDIGELLLLCIPRIQRHDRMVRRLGPRVR